MRSERRGRKEREGLSGGGGGGATREGRGDGPQQPPSWGQAPKGKAIRSTAYATTKGFGFDRACCAAAGALAKRRDASDFRS